MHNSHWDGALRWFSIALARFGICMVSEVFLSKIIQESPQLLWDAQRSTKRLKWSNESQIASAISATAKKNGSNKSKIISITDNTDSTTLFDILRHPKGYGVFMGHLIRFFSALYFLFCAHIWKIACSFGTLEKKKASVCVLCSEISSENLLCYTELIQYLQLFKYCEDDCKKELQDINTGEWDGRLVTCEENGLEIIPLSDVICNVLSVERQSQITSVTIAQLYDIAYGLSVKYFEDTSSCQVNISEMDRNRVLHTFGHDGRRRDTLTAADIRFFYELYRDSVREMYFLMNGAFTRFASTKGYEQLLVEMV
ncbi:hypothetical protein RFI_22064 [Reticulomyxa filosa]|uniref:Uncharacterized protein n=1 Tax=Reticulomyxa filosa TaxID=46433 RepID=X6MMR1_RETFI|nr:hypothetical protein RFI_22064 [Reticulomyxa filosa]|eukprot:ETO15298.1 hypothetical protein RFI_22064 [Reticulomyxa filosa]